MTAGRKNTTERKDWGTPQRYVDAIRDFFGGVIDLDPCSSAHSIVHAVKEYVLPDTDGLKETWDFKRIFVNPPYGRDKYRNTTIKNWLKKCVDSYDLYGAEILALIPVATNTTHWKLCVWGRASAICFLYDTRLQFLMSGVEGGKGAPMACAMIYWGNNIENFQKIFNGFGAIVDIRNQEQKSEKVGDKK